MSLLPLQGPGVQCPVCRETLIYDLSALQAAPPPQHPLVSGTYLGLSSLAVQPSCSEDSVRHGPAPAAQSRMFYRPLVYILIVLALLGVCTGFA